MVFGRRYPIAIGDIVAKTGRSLRMLVVDFGTDPITSAPTICCAWSPRPGQAAERWFNRSDLVVLKRVQ